MHYFSNVASTLTVLAQRISTETRQKVDAYAPRLNLQYENAMRHEYGVEQVVKLG